MSIVSKQYTGNGSTKNFASDFKILSESHVDVLVNGVSISKSDYDTINSSVVFAAAPASGAAVVVRVGTTPDDLLTSTTNIDTVAANIADINTIEDNLTAINTTATNISSVTTNATNISNINTVADIGSDGLQGIVDNVDNIETVASVYNQVQTVAGIANAVSTVSSNSVAIVAAGDNTTNINTVAGNSTNINTLAADIAEINEIYTNRAEIYQADTNAATATAQATIATTKASQASASASAASSSASAASSSASAASGSASTATTQASNASSSASAASSSATSASNSASAAASSASSASSSASTATTKASEASASALSASNSLDSFNDNYTSSTTAPTSPEEGTLWFDTSTDIMKVYNGSSWQSAGSSVNGTSERQTYTATAGQTVFNATYDSGFVDVYLNGIKILDGTDFTATNGSSIVLSSGATAGDIVDIVAYGTFELADVYTQAQADVLLADKADTTYVDSELADKADISYVDAIPSSLSKVASNVLLSGNLALASSAVTKSNANITYTGNGSTQSITTGIASVDFTVASNGSGYYHDRTAGDCIVKNDAGTVIESGSAVVNTSKVHIKARNIVVSHLVVDGIRGVSKNIATDLTDSESAGGTSPSLYGTVSAFSSSGVSVLDGSNSTYDNANGSGRTYILHQTLYTHIKWGLTSQGKRYLTAYNPVTREVMTMYQGSGVAGHQIPNALGIKLDYVEVKNLDNTTSWTVSIGENQRLILNDTRAVESEDNISSTNSDFFTVDATTLVNTSNYSYISYGFANSETKIITQYQGTGASGNFVETKDVNGVAKKPRRVILKATSTTGNWWTFDSKRGVSTASSYFINLNTSSAELADANYDFSINGFKIGTTGNEVNASGGQYIAIVEFDTTNSTDDTYFDYPTDDTNLNVTAGKLPYTDGRDTTNGAYNVFTQSYTGSVDFSTCPDGIHYVALDSNNAPKFYEKVAIGSYEKEAADDNRLVFNTDDGKWYTTTGGELVTNGTFDSDVSGWDMGVSTATVVNGRLEYYGSSVWITQAIAVEIGKEHFFNFNYITNSGTRAAVFLGNSSVSEDYYSSPSVDSLTVSNFSFIPTQSTIYISLLDRSDGTGSYDNISVSKASSTLDTALTTPISFIDDKPYQVASGTPMDRLVDYPSIPKNVMESSYVDGDLEVSGEVKGKNQCTAWVNFDGTTTPPTIRDSYNVKDVVRTSNGVFKIYFEEAMDNVNYSASGSSTVGTRWNFLSVQTQTTTYATAVIVDDAGGVQNPSNVSLKVFGGK